MNALRGLLITFLAVIAGCATTAEIEGTSTAPAAKAELSAEIDQNDNTKFHIEVNHLAEPGRLDPAKDNYLVWVVTQNGRQILMGKLNVTDDATAEFSGVAPVEPFRVLITAENGTPKAPSDTVVLRSKMLSPRS